MPLHLECCKVRTASVYVISALLEAGADPCALVCGGDVARNATELTPLTMVLQRGAAAAAHDLHAGGHVYLVLRNHETWL